MRHSPGKMQPLLIRIILLNICDDLLCRGYADVAEEINVKTYLLLSFVTFFAFYIVLNKSKRKEKRTFEFRLH